MRPGVRLNSPSLRDVRLRHSQSASPSSKSRSRCTLSAWLPLVFGMAIGSVRGYGYGYGASRQFSSESGSDESNESSGAGSNEEAEVEVSVKEAAKGVQPGLLRRVSFKEEVLVITDTAREITTLSSKAPKRRLKEPPAPRQSKTRKAEETTGDAPGKTSEDGFTQDAPLSEAEPSGHVEVPQDAVLEEPVEPRAEDVHVRSDPELSSLPVKEKADVRDEGEANLEGVKKKQKKVKENTKSQKEKQKKEKKGKEKEKKKGKKKKKLSEDVENEDALQKEVAPVSPPKHLEMRPADAGAEFASFWADKRATEPAKLVSPFDVAGSVGMAFGDPVSSSRHRRRSQDRRRRRRHSKHEDGQSRQRATALPEADGFGASWNEGHQGSTSPIAVETTQPAQPATFSLRESIGETGKKADESDSSEIVGAEVPEPENLVTELSEKESEANGRANGQATSEPSRAPKRRAPAARKSAAKPPPRLKGRADEDSDWEGGDGDLQLGLRAALGASDEVMEVGKPNSSEVSGKRSKWPTVSWPVALQPLKLPKAVCWQASSLKSHELQRRQAQRAPTAAPEGEALEPEVKESRPEVVKRGIRLAGEWRPPPLLRLPPEIAWNASSYRGTELAVRLSNRKAEMEASNEYTSKLVALMRQLESQISEPATVLRHFWSTLAPSERTRFSREFPQFQQHLQFEPGFV